MNLPPTKPKLTLEIVLSICAGLAAIIWMILIFAVGMTMPAYIAAAVFVICAASSSLLHYRMVKDLPAAEKEPPASLPFFRQIDKPVSYCADCGSPLRKSDLFCPKCGKKAADLE